MCSLERKEPATLLELSSHAIHRRLAGREDLGTFVERETGLPRDQFRFLSRVPRLVEFGLDRAGAIVSYHFPVRASLKDYFRSLVVKEFVFRLTLNTSGFTRGVLVTAAFVKKAFAGVASVFLRLPFPPEPSSLHDLVNQVLATSEGKDIIRSHLPKNRTFRVEETILTKYFSPDPAIKENITLGRVDSVHKCHLSGPAVIFSSEEGDDLRIQSYRRAFGRLRTVFSTLASSNFINISPTGWQ